VQLPEHTLAAYQQAIEAGIDGLECDVRLSRDGHLICIHDRRLDRTSNGRGRVSAATLAQLELLDFGSWHAPRPHPVLTLRRLLEAVVDAGRPLRLLIETKHPSRFGAQVEQRLIALLAQFGLTDGAAAGVAVSIMSFSPRALLRARALAPALDTVYLFEFATPGVRRGRLPLRASVLGPSISVVRANPNLIARAHQRGHQVYVWTVNTPADQDLAIELGADAIITDVPAQLLARLGR
jgi:glycerophosphoryl diester phosphodiesterase